MAIHCRQGCRLDPFVSTRENVLRHVGGRADEMVFFAFRSGDFTLYDHILDAANVVNAIPERYTKSGLSALDIAFGEFQTRLWSVPENAYQISCSL